MKTPLIQFDDVYKTFRNNPVLMGVNLTIHKSEVTTIIGKSGVGKSVLLKHIIGLLEPDSGRILFEGRAISDMKKAERAKYKRKFSYMFQGTALFDSMTVFENIALPLKERNRLGEKEIRALVLNKMAQLDIEAIESRYPSQLSGGMKKRVALARALITDPEIVLFDEPTTGLDPIRKNAVHSMISEYQERFGFTAVVISHEIPDIFYISQNIAMLDRGRIIFEGTPEDLQNLTDPVVNDFIRGLENRHDNMTGLAPLPQGQSRFKEEISKLHRYNTIFSIIVFKIENLGEVSERSSHIIAQTGLKNFTSRLQQHLREADVCFRYGLDKIMALLPNTNTDEAKMACTKLSREMTLREILDIQPYPGFCLLVSVGYAAVQKDSQLEQVLESARSEPNILCEFKVC